MPLPAPPPATPLPTDLRLITQACVEGARERIAESGVRFFLSVPIHFPPLPLIRWQFRSVIDTLLDRALETTGTGGIIVIRLYSDPGCVYLAIADTGSGGAVEGEALRMCRRIIERHGGRLRVAREEGAGTTFTLTMPIG